MPLGDDSDFTSICKEWLWKSSFRKLNHNCHIGNLAGKALQLGVMAGKGEKKWRRPLVRPQTAIVRCRVPFAEEVNVSQR